MIIKGTAKTSTDVKNNHCLGKIVVSSFSWVSTKGWLCTLWSLSPTYLGGLGGRENIFKEQDKFLVGCWLLPITGKFFSS